MARHRGDGVCPGVSSRVNARSGIPRILLLHVGSDRGVGVPAIQYSAVLRPHAAVGAGAVRQQPCLSGRHIISYAIILDYIILCCLVLII